MRTIITLLTALLFSIPAAAQLIPAAKVARTAEGALRNARRFNTSLTLTPSKQILNFKFRYKREYQQATRLYHKIQQAPAINLQSLKTDINTQIRNNTLRSSLLSLLQIQNYSVMLQEMEEYFHLAPQLPFFAASAAPQESFAHAVQNYMKLHPHKPSWRLRETIQFGGMKHIKPALEETVSAPEESVTALDNIPEQEKSVLTELYRQAEENNVVIKNFITKSQLTPAESEEMLAALRKSYLLYEELINFAQNAPAVRDTVEIYTQLAKETEEFMLQHRRAPSWENPEERELANLFPVLVFHNQANMFEEMIPIMNKLYTLTEQYPTRRLSAAETLRYVEDFLNKYHHMPRSVHIRDFFDTKPDEALLYEAMLYWRHADPTFGEKLIQMEHPTWQNRPPSF